MCVSQILPVRPPFSPFHLLLWPSQTVINRRLGVNLCMGRKFRRNAWMCRGQRLLHERERQGGKQYPRRNSCRLLRSVTTMEMTRLGRPTVSVFRYCRSTHGCEVSSIPLLQQLPEGSLERACAIAFLCGSLDSRGTYRQNLQDKHCVLLSYFTNQFIAVFIFQITISPSSCLRFRDRGSSTQNCCKSFLLPFYFLILVVVFYFG